MAKVTIVIEDDQDGDSARVDMSWNPPYHRGEVPTPAQVMALDIVQRYGQGPVFEAEGGTITPAQEVSFYGPEELN